MDSSYVQRAKSNGLSLTTVRLNADHALWCEQESARMGIDAGNSRFESVVWYAYRRTVHRS